MRPLAILVALVFVAFGGDWLWNSDQGVEWEALEHQARADDVAQDLGELAASKPLAPLKQTAKDAAAERTALEAEAWLTVLTASVPPEGAPLGPQGDTHVSIDALVRDEERGVLLLVAHRGLYVRGRVLQPDGSPAENVHVFLARIIHEHAPQTAQPAGIAGLSAPDVTLRNLATSTTRSGSPSSPEPSKHRQEPIC